MIPRLFILSTGRAGSRYISQVLTESGLSCGHERFFNPHDTFLKGRVAESSYLALPHIETGKYEGKCIHQVRSPLAVISSFLNGQMEKNAHIPRAHFQQLKKRAGYVHLPQTKEEWLAHTVQYIQEWNERCARLSQFTYRLEDIDEDIILRIAKTINYPLSIDSIRYTLSNTPRSVNKHPKGPDISWDDLPETKHTYLLRKDARDWGYL